MTNSDNRMDHLLWNSSSREKYFNHPVKTFPASSSSSCSSSTMSVSKHSTKYDSIINSRGGRSHWNLSRPSTHHHHPLQLLLFQHNTIHNKHAKNNQIFRNNNNMMHHFLILLLTTTTFFSLFSEIGTVKIVRHTIGQSINGRWTTSSAVSTASATSSSHPAAAVRQTANSNSKLPTPAPESSSSSILLDCDYIYDPGDVKLVVRWFFNDSPEPIYQWIPESDKRYIGELIRSHFDVDFRIGNDRFTKYRALRLIPAKPPSAPHNSGHHHSVNSSGHNSHRTTSNHHHHNNHPVLPTSLSGNYTCVISSIMSQDSRQGQLIVYVPPKKFEFNFLAYSSSSDTKNSPDQSGPVLRCVADQVYPKPFLTFSELSANANFHHFPEVSVQTKLNQSSQLYQSWFEHPLNVSLLKVGTVYECKLELPSTNFIRKKRIKLIYPSTYSYADNKNQDGGSESQDWKQRNWHQSTRLPPLPFGTKSDFQTSLVYKNNNNNGGHGAISGSTSGSMSTYHEIAIKMLIYSTMAISILINCIQQSTIGRFTYDSVE